MQEPNLANTSMSNTNLNEAFTYSSTMENSGNTKSYFSYENHTKTYPFFRGIDIIEIPKKLEAIVKRYIPKSTLRAIDKDIEVAREKILFFASQIASYNQGKYLNDSRDPYKRINTKLILNILGLRHSKWKTLIRFLEKGTSKGAIITINKSFLAGTFSKGYSFTDTYLKSGLTYYTLETEAVKHLAEKSFFSTVSEWSNNPIITNNLKLYPKLNIPSLQEVNDEAKRLHKTVYKGKTFIYKGKKSKESFGKPKDFIYSSDGIERLTHLTTQGFPLPKVGTDRDGYRVYDIITSMPKWIRKLITIDGERMSEIDINCSHPNFAAKLYFNEGASITHKEVAEFLNMDVNKTKKQHLIYINQELDSYFNEGNYTYGANLNNVDKYYREVHPELHSALEYEKNWGEYGYKTVYRALFMAEREFMTKLITLLNKEGIIVGYCFDAIFVKQSEAVQAKAIMDKLLLESDVNTTTSITNY